MNIIWKNILFLLIWTFAACTTPRQEAFNLFLPDSELIQKNYQVGDRLAFLLGQKGISSQPILIASFANLNKMDDSSPLGRLIPQQIASRLSQLGFTTIDIRLRSQNLLVQKEKGEFALSRDIKSLALQTKGKSILAGTFSHLSGLIYVNVKILNCQDSTVLAAYDYTLQDYEHGPAPIKPSVKTTLPQ